MIPLGRNKARKWSQDSVSADYNSQQAVNQQTRTLPFPTITNILQWTNGKAEILFFICMRLVIALVFDLAKPFDKGDIINQV